MLEFNNDSNQLGLGVWALGPPVTCSFSALGKLRGWGALEVEIPGGICVC